MYSPVAGQDHRRDTTAVPEMLEPRLEQRRDHQGTAGEDMETTDGQGLVTGRNPAPPRKISKYPHESADFPRARDRRSCSHAKAKPGLSVTWGAVLDGCDRVQDTERTHGLAKRTARPASNAAVWPGGDGG